MPITAQKRTDSVPTKNTLEDIVKFGPSIDTLTDKTSSEINSVDDMIELLDGVLSVFPVMRATLINTVLVNKLQKYKQNDIISFFRAQLSSSSGQLCELCQTGQTTRKESEEV